MLHVASNIWSRTSQWICSSTDLLAMTEPRSAVNGRKNHWDHSDPQWCTIKQIIKAKPGLWNKKHRSNNQEKKDKERNKKWKKEAGIESMVQTVTRGMSKPWSKNIKLHIPEHFCHWVTQIVCYRNTDLPDGRKSTYNIDSFSLSERFLFC